MVPASGTKSGKNSRTEGLGSKAEYHTPLFSFPPPYLFSLPSPVLFASLYPFPTLLSFSPLLVFSPLPSFPSPFFLPYSSYGSGERCKLPAGSVAELLKLAYFSHHRVLNVPDEGVPLGIWYRRKESRMIP